MNDRNLFYTRSLTYSFPDLSLRSKRENSDEKSKPIDATSAAKSLRLDTKSPHVLRSPQRTAHSPSIRDSTDRVTNRKVIEVNHVPQLRIRKFSEHESRDSNSSPMSRISRESCEKDRESNAMQMASGTAKEHEDSESEPDCSADCSYNIKECPYCKFLVVCKSESSFEDHLLICPVYGTLKKLVLKKSKVEKRDDR